MEKRQKHNSQVEILPTNENNVNINFNQQQSNNMPKRNIYRRYDVGTKGADLKVTSVEEQVIEKQLQGLGIM